MVNPRKIYPIDPALIPMFDQSGRANSGHSLETCVMLELERRGAELSYVRNATGSEVDFIARFPDGRRELIQVCADMEAKGVRDRELRGLTDAIISYRNATAHLVVLRPDRPEGLPNSVHWHAASDWLLSTNA